MFSIATQLGVMVIMPSELSGAKAATTTCEQPDDSRDAGDIPLLPLLEDADVQASYRASNASHDRSAILLLSPIANTNLADGSSTCLDSHSDERSSEYSVPVISEPRLVTRCFRQLRGLQTATGRWWWWELSAALLSITCMFAIFTILACWDNRPLRHWNIGLQPNSIIATLNTIAKTAMLVVIASSISQFKWAHYQRQARPLNHFQYFDEASRGPWGSFTLMIKLRTSAASVGALLTILSLGMEPSAQQILAFPLRSTALTNVTASLGVATIYNSSIRQLQPGPDRAIANMKFRTYAERAAMGEPLFPDFECPEYADECFWPSYFTLAVCPTCEEYARHSTPRVNGKASATKCPVLCLVHSSPLLLPRDLLGQTLGILDKCLQLAQILVS